MRKTDYLILGGGGAGLTAAFTAKGFGKEVIIIEKDQLGGECTWSGCVPSKTLINSAKIAHELNTLESYGLELEEDLAINTQGVMEHVQSIQNKIFSHESPEALNEKGIETIKGEGYFIGKNQVKVNDLVIEAKKIIIATGSKPKIPPIKDLKKINFLTNETLFRLKAIPKSIGIIGAGAIGIEMAQSLNRLGSQVIVFLRGKDILKKEPKDIRKAMKEQLVREGVIFKDNFSINNIQIIQDEIIQINNQIDVEQLLIATGRQVITDDLQLSKAHIEIDDHGNIKTNDYLQTTNKNVYCCGDIIGPYRLSHMAYEQGKTAVMNSLLPINQKIPYKNLPWVVFTDPEIAHLGLDTDDKKSYTFTINYNDNERAITENKTFGFITVITDSKYQILNTYILGHRAGELIHHFQIIKTMKIPLYNLEKLIYAYPTYSEMLREISKKAKLHRLKHSFFYKIYEKFS